jgi:hypothetical protein
MPVMTAWDSLSTNASLDTTATTFFTIAREEKTERRVMRDGKVERRPECYAKVKETVIDVRTAVPG